MTVHELLHRISARELVEWQIYYSLEPFGVERADLQHGQVAATIANCYRSKGQKAYQAGDFVLCFERPKAQSPQEMAEYLKRLTVQMGGTVRG